MTKRAGTRLLILLLILAAIAAAYLLVGPYLSFEWLKAQRTALSAQVAAQPLLFAGAFLLLYAVVTALSIPGAVILTLAGGAIFGLWAGLVLVSLASVTGAVLSFLGSRYLLRDWVERRFGRRIQAVNAGLERDGALYLLALRLNPAIPFFLVNLGLGLTRMGVLRYALISQVGMLPATFVYVNAGTQLARIERLADIASAQVIVSLVLLSLLPLFGKWAASRIRRGRIYRGWQRPRRFDRNMIVIGAGAGGLVSAYIGATLRAKVTLVEGRKTGGDCLNTGCVPSKALIRAARAAHEVRHAGDFGIRVAPPEVDMAAVMARIRAVIRHIAPADSPERFEAMGVDVRLGHARLIDPWTVEIDGRDRLTASHIVLATGADPAVPPIPGLSESGYLTSETLWDALERRGTLPSRLAIVGGGPIGVEMAQSFARLGCAVTLLEAGARLLPKDDPEASALIEEVLKGEGVAVLTQHKAMRVDGGLLEAAPGSGAPVTVPFDEILIATGRRARLSGYGLEELGYPVDQPLEIDDFLQTRFPHILAVGDVSGRFQLTHAASHQAWHAAVNSLFGQLKRFRVDYSLMPWVTYCDPEVAHVGHTEESARAAGASTEVVRYPLSHLDRAVTEGAANGFVKLLIGPKGRILGCTIVAHNAGELIAEVSLAMKHKIPVGKLLSQIKAYPTMSEAVRFAASEWRQRHKPERALDWLGRYHRWRRG